jgi:hypothetical protein
MTTSVRRLPGGIVTLVTDLGHTKIQTRVYNYFDVDSEPLLREHQWRVEQMTPQPKIEFERDPDDWDEDFD